MNFIKKIFDGETDESVHSQFRKFSKGEFIDRAFVEVKNSKGKYTIKTSAEFANELVRYVAKKLGENKTNVKGAIVSTSDLKNELEFENIKQFQGVKRYLINSEMSGTEILELLDKFPKTFFALSFSFGDYVLKIKPKASKTPKRGKEGEVKADFCSLKTTDSEIGKSFVFEVPNFSKVSIAHDYIITGMEVSEELKKTNDFSKIREDAKRVGKIVRKAIIDEKEMNSEKEFVA